MIEEFAVITKSNDGNATLEIERGTACGICGQKRGCGNATWGKLLGHQSQEFIAENSINAKVGDTVVVGIDEKIMLGSVLFMYLLPLAAMAVAAVTADVLLDNQFYVALAAASGLVAGFYAARTLSERHLGQTGAGPRYYAKVLRHADATNNMDNSGSCS